MKLSQSNSSTLQIRFNGLLAIVLFTSSAFAQYCNPIEIKEKEFQAETKFVKVEAEWFSSWIEYNEGKVVYPKTLEPLPKWKFLH